MLTACYVAQALRFFKSSRRALVLHPPTEDGDPLEWRNVDDGETVCKPFALNAPALDTLEKSFALCMGGDGVSALLEKHSDKLKEVHRLLARVKVFARTSPEQKEYIVTSLGDLGLITLMCGDGTNDVGALKQAHVGVGLLETDGSSTSGRKPRTKTKRSSKKDSLQLLGGYPNHLSICVV